MRKIALLSLALLAACAAQPSSGGSVFNLATPQEERDTGFDAAQIILKGEGLYRPGTTTTAYVKNLCEKIFDATGAADMPLQCDFIDENEFNAFATPGYMLVNRGLLAYLSSEEELAFVLGHESGHLTSRHIAQALTRLKLGNLADALLVASTATSNDPLITQSVIEADKQLFAVTHMTFTRGEEAEADALGRRYMEAAGYNPKESVTAARAMLQYEKYNDAQVSVFTNGKGKPGGILQKLKSSHPATDSRVEEAIASVGKPEPTLNSPGRRRYMEAIEGLPYGPAHRYGIARKNELVLTQQHTIIPLPQGSTSNYIASHIEKELGTWLVGQPESKTYFTITSYKMKTGHSPAWLVQTLLPTLHDTVERIKVGQPEKQTSAFTATYRFLLNDRRYRLLAVSAPYPVDEMLLITIVYPNEATMQQEDGDMLAGLQKMNFITKEAAEKYQQLTLHTFTATAGDSVAHRAAKLPVGALQEDLFRALNNLPEGTEMTVGQTYKTILDPNP